MIVHRGFINAILRDTHARFWDDRSNLENQDDFTRWSTFRWWTVSLDCCINSKDVVHKYSVAYIVRTVSLLASIDLLIDRHTTVVKLKVKNTNSTANDLSDTIQWNLATDLNKYKEIYICIARLCVKIQIIQEFLKNYTNLIIPSVNSNL